MNITVSVMAHPKRRESAEKLAIELKMYSFMDVSITYDQINNEWDTGKRSLLKGVNRGDWHLVIQDDAILTPNFYENIDGAIRNVPTRVLISLYTGKGIPLAKRVQNAVDRASSASWLSFNMLCWGVAILIPSDHIEPLLDFVDNERYANTLYDNRIGMFYQRNMLPIYYTMPCLVNHDDDIGSLLGNAEKDRVRRVAHKLAAGPVSWNSDVIAI